MLIKKGGSSGTVGFLVRVQIWGKPDLTKVLKVQHKFTIKQEFLAYDPGSSVAADRVERCCRLPVARALRLPLLPLVPRADWLVARRSGVDAQTYIRDVLMWSLQYPNVPTPFPDFWVVDLGHQQMLLHSPSPPLTSILIIIILGTHFNFAGRQLNEKKVRYRNRISDAHTCQY